MTESPTPSKFAKWKRSLIGGLLSALVPAVAGILWEDAQMDLLGLLLLSGLFGIPTFVLEFFLSISNTLLEVILGVGIWFGIGAIIARLVKSDMWAVLLWLLILIILTAISFVAMIGLCCPGT